MPPTDPPPPPRPPPPNGPRPRIILPASDEDLLAECEVDVYRSSGPGGQHVNTTNSAVRLRHRSGLVVTCQSARSQFENKNECLRRLREKVARLNHRDPPRKKTKPSRAAKARQLEAKHRTAGRKEMRRKPGRED